jgi:hypothetical protein
LAEKQIESEAKEALLMSSKSVSDLMFFAIKSSPSRAY